MAFCLLCSVGLASASDLRLANGCRVISSAGPGPLTVTARVEAGWSFDPPGKEGLAELTASCLPLATQAHDDPSALAGAVGEVAGGAYISTGADAAHLVLTGVKDLRGATSLLGEILALPAFPWPLVHAERSRWALATLEGLRGDVRRHGEAVDALARAPRPRSDAWSVLALRAADIAEFHAARYRPDLTTIVVTGEGAPEGEALRELTEASLLSWTAPRDPARAMPARPPLVKASPPAVLLSGGDSSALCVAFPVPAQGGAAAVLALRAALARAGAPASRLQVLGEALTPAGDLVATAGSVLMVDGPVEDPGAAVEGLLAGLREASRLSRGQRLEQVPATAKVDAEDEGIALSETAASGGPAPTEVPATEVARAARGLLGGQRAVVVQAPESDAASRAWLEKHPTAIVKPLGEPSHPAERACAEEGRRWMRSAVEAAGGDGVMGLARITRVSQTLEDTPGREAKLLFETRLDLDLSSNDWRLENRPYQYRGEPVVQVASGPEAWLRNVEFGVVSIDAFQRLAQDLRRLRDPVALLQRSASPQVAVRSAGFVVGEDHPVIRIEMADPVAGLTTVDVDASTSLIDGVSYEVVLDPDDEPARIREDFSGFRDFGGIVLPTRITTSSTTLGERRAVEESCAWSFLAGGANLLTMETDAHDITHIMLGTE